MRAKQEFGTKAQAVREVQRLRLELSEAAKAARCRAKKAERKSNRELVRLNAALGVRDAKLFAVENYLRAALAKIEQRVES